MQTPKAVRERMASRRRQREQEERQRKTTQSQRTRNRRTTTTTSSKNQHYDQPDLSPNPSGAPWVQHHNSPQRWILDEESTDSEAEIEELIRSHPDCELEPNKILVLLSHRDQLQSTLESMDDVDDTPITLFTPVKSVEASSVRAREAVMAAGVEENEDSSSFSSVDAASLKEQSWFTTDHLPVSPPQPLSAPSTPRRASMSLDSLSCTLDDTPTSAAIALRRQAELEKLDRMVRQRRGFDQALDKGVFERATQLKRWREHRIKALPLAHNEAERERRSRKEDLHVQLWKQDNPTATPPAALFREDPSAPSRFRNLTLFQSYRANHRTPPQITPARRAQFVRTQQDSSLFEDDTVLFAEDDEGDAPRITDYPKSYGPIGLMQYRRIVNTWHLLTPTWHELLVSLELLLSHPPASLFDHRVHPEVEHFAALLSTHSVKQENTLKQYARLVEQFATFVLHFGDSSIHYSRFAGCCFPCLLVLYARTQHFSPYTTLSMTDAVNFALNCAGLQPIHGTLHKFLKQRVFGTMLRYHTNERGPAPMVPYHKVGDLLRLGEVGRKVSEAVPLEPFEIAFPIAYYFLLRSNELLQVTRDRIDVEPTEDGRWKVRLRLYRKSVDPTRANRLLGVVCNERDAEGFCNLMHALYSLPDEDPNARVLDKPLFSSNTVYNTILKSQSTEILGFALTTHSFRRSRARHLWEDLAMPFEDIKVKGNWKEDATLMRYLGTR